MNVLLWIAALISSVFGQRFLEARNGQLRLNNEKVFMSGMNIAWHNFGNDFGNGQYQGGTKGPLENYLQRIADNGGNSIRIWIHTDGRSTPEFNSDGYITAPDRTGSMIQDLTAFLDRARSLNILVFLVLWNGAANMPERYRNLYWDESKLTSYIDNALTPMVEGLAGKQALGSWEVVNEPEGIVLNDRSDSNPCFDTSVLRGSGAGWAGGNVPMSNILRFINWQADAIRRADPKALVTLGSWNEKAQNDRFSGSRNYYTDTCLRQAGGRQEGVIDFQQMHTYAWRGRFQDSSPLKIPNNRFGLSKPNVVGEFSQSGGDGMTIENMFEWCYNSGYSGAWSWQANGGGHNSDSFDVQARGLRQIRGRNDPSRGGRINFTFQ